MQEYVWHTRRKEDENIENDLEVLKRASRKNYFQLFEFVAYFCKYLYLHLPESSYSWKSVARMQKTRPI